MWTFVAAGLLALLANEPVAGADGSGKPAFRLIPISHVRVGGEIGRRIQLTIDENLHKLDLAPGGQFFRPFERQSWPADGGDYGGYVGLGKTLDATVRFAAYTRDPRVLALKEDIVRRLLATRTADGYIGTFTTDSRIAASFDLHEMVYLILALVDDFRYFGDQGSLDAARGMADYIMRIKTSKWLLDNLDIQKTGAERAFAALAEVTGDAKYRDYGAECHDIRHWHPPVQGHAYIFLYRCLSQLDLYRAEGTPSLLDESHKAIDFLTGNDGMVVTGECGIGEQFHTDQEGAGHLGESCATAYLIRICHHLFQLEGDSLCGDLMERAIYNGLFAAQSADGRRLRYYTCSEGPRVYMNTDTYCCPGNWRRIVSELPEMLYYTADNGFAVTLYAESTARLDLKTGVSVAVRQETDYPNSGRVALTVDPSTPSTFAVRLRIPRWCSRPEVRVNGHRLTDVKPGTLFAIQREWKPGDRVRLDLPMEPRLVQGRKSQAGKAAVLRGPVVFCLANQTQTPEQMAELRRRIAEVDAELGGLDGRPVNLADIAGGGGGFGAGRAGNGIDPRTGRIVGGMIGEIWWHKANEFKTTESPFIDGIIVPNGARGPVPISSTGLTVSDVPPTCDMTNGYLVDGPKNAQHWKPTDGPEYGATISPMAGLPQPYFNTRVADIDYAEGGHSILGMEANKAVTFDLAAIRKATGYSSLSFQSTVGYASREEPTVDVATYVDGRPALPRTAVTRQPLPLAIPLDASARFLTLMVTDQNGKKNDFDIIPSDAVIFGDPVLVPEARTTPETSDTAKRRARLTAELAKLKKQDRQFLEPLDRPKDIVLDPASISGPLRDARTRPDGMGLKVKAWSPSRDRSLRPDLTLILSEFADPEGRATYFAFDSQGSASPDELVVPASK